MVANAAHRHHVNEFVLISTDKAVQSDQSDGVHQSRSPNGIVLRWEIFQRPSSLSHDSEMFWVQKVVLSRYFESRSKMVVPLRLPTRE